VLGLRWVRRSDEGSSEAGSSCAYAVSWLFDVGAWAAKEACEDALQGEWTNVGDTRLSLPRRAPSVRTAASATRNNAAMLSAGGRERSGAASGRELNDRLQGDAEQEFVRRRVRSSISSNTIGGRGECLQLRRSSRVRVSGRSWTVPPLLSSAQLRSAPRRTGRSRREERRQQRHSRRRKDRRTGRVGTLFLLCVPVGFMCSCCASGLRVRHEFESDMV
jgi:hypothetical protein